jgi:anti-sigma factor RsiW
MSSDYLACRQLVELVTEYFDDAVSPADRSLFEQHIMSCPPCRGYLEQMRETIRLLGSLPEETVSPEAEEALVAALKGWKSA